MRRSALALILGCLLLVAGVSALDGYAYYQTVEYAATDKDVYQQDIVIHRSAGTAYNETSGGLETWHIYVGDHCREDYGDIRFTNSTGAELAYYLWPDYSSESARFAVRLEGATSAGGLTVYYGNPSAETASDSGSLLRPVEGSTMYLPLDEGSGSTTADISGNNNNGTLVGGPTWVDGPFKKALKFTGSNQVTIPYSAALNRYQTDFTISAWINLDAYPSEWVGAIVSNRNAGGTGGSLFFVRGELDPTYKRRIAFDTSIDTTGRFVWGTTPLTTGRWYHVAMTYEYVGGNLNQVTLYLDGVPEATGTVNDIASSAEGTVIGYEPASPPASYHLRGTVDEVAIYSRVLTPSEILGIANSYSVTPPAAITFSGEQENPSPPVTAFTANTTAGLAPLTVQFTDLSGGRPTSWLWTFGDGNTSTAQNPQHTYTAPGLYTVTLNATNEYGSDEEIRTDYITVYAPVTAQFSANITSGIAPLTVQFTDLSTGGPTSWLWTFGDGNTSTNQNPVHTYTTAGTHTVTLTASHPYDSDTETKTAYITVAVLQPFPGLTLIPRDLTGNGLYTDINGNNRLDYNDLTVFFQNLAWAKTAQPTSCFDFNGNNRLDYNDVITLFSIIMEEHT